MIINPSLKGHKPATAGREYLRAHPACSFLRCCENAACLSLNEKKANRNPLLDSILNTKYRQFFCFAEEPVRCLVLTAASVPGAPLVASLALSLSFGMVETVEWASPSASAVTLTFFPSTRFDELHLPIQTDGFSCFLPACLAEADLSLFPFEELPSQTSKG